ncbi:MAG: hotdog fold thioesterase [Saprospiraceae bacterium]
MSDSEKAHKIVHQLMFDHDAYSQWMNIVILEVDSGYCKLKAQINKEMLNGFGFCHGGISYSLGDSALAFASNSHGIKAVSIETSISHFQKIYEGDTIYAAARELKLTSKLGWYEIALTNQKEDLVAIFRGTVSRTGQLWEW